VALQASHAGKMRRWRWIQMFTPFSDVPLPGETDAAQREAHTLFGVWHNNLFPTRIWLATAVQARPGE
jgi:hypothetical protein